MPESGYTIKEVMERNHKEDMDAHHEIMDRLDLINGRVRKNELNIARVMTVGSIAVIVIPIVIDVILRHI